MLTIYDVIKKSHVTEKAMRLSEDQNVFSLVVHKLANKKLVAHAVATIWKVEVLSVKIVMKPSKSKSFRGKRGVQSGFKKALVKLKAGQKIEGWT